MKDYKLGGMGQEEQTVGGCENKTSGNMRKGSPELPMHRKQLMMVLTLRWARRPGEPENGFEVISLCLLPIARTPRIHWLDTCGNNSALLDPFYMPCIMVLETLVSFHFLIFLFCPSFYFFPLFYLLYSLNQLFSYLWHCSPRNKPQSLFL